MASAADARDWAPGALRGIVDSLYTPFSGPAAEHVDEEALRRPRSPIASGRWTTMGSGSVGSSASAGR